ncbi:uncharacterized protein I303_100565 [Kwoniella dejecticola CBS 10117]|uniref:Uncharacterized protein n=1 Tax=Kwoniella dejecticola CBS 10117 TaxID=1296121 RepID=A0AAJ8KIA8_9TREE
MSHLTIFKSVSSIPVRSTILLLFALTAFPQTTASSSAIIDRDDDDLDEAKDENEVDCEYNGSVGDYVSCTKNKISTPMLIGAGVGIALGIFLLSFLCIWLTRKRRKRAAQQDIEHTLPVAEAEFIQVDVDGLMKKDNYKFDNRDIKHVPEEGSQAQTDLSRIDQDALAQNHKSNLIVDPKEDPGNGQTQAQENGKDHIVHLYSNKGSKAHKISFRLLDPPTRIRPSLSSLSNTNSSPPGPTEPLRIRPSIRKGSRDEMHPSNDNDDGEKGKTTQLKHAPSTRRPDPTNQHKIHHSINGSIHAQPRLQAAHQAQAPTLIDNRNGGLHFQDLTNDGAMINSRSGSPVPYTQTQGLAIANPNVGVLSRENSLYAQTKHVSRRFSSTITNSSQSQTQPRSQAQQTRPETQIGTKIQRLQPSHQVHDQTKLSISSLPKSTDRASDIRTSSPAVSGAGVTVFPNSLSGPQPPLKITKSHKPLAPLRGYSNSHPNSDADQGKINLLSTREFPDEELRNGEKGKDIANARSGTFGPPVLYANGNANPNPESASRQSSLIVPPSENGGGKTESPASSPSTLPLDPAESTARSTSPKERTKGVSSSEADADSQKTASVVEHASNKEEQGKITKTADQAIQTIAESTDARDHASAGAVAGTGAGAPASHAATIDASSPDELSNPNHTAVTESDSTRDSIPSPKPNAMPEESLIRSGTVSASRRKQLRNTNLIPSYYVKLNPLEADNNNNAQQEKEAPRPRAAAAKDSRERSKKSRKDKSKD